MLKRLYARLQAKIHARRRYRALVAEIEMLSQADLMELGAFQIDLYRRPARKLSADRRPCGVICRGPLRASAL